MKRVVLIGWIACFWSAAVGHCEERSASRVLDTNIVLMLMKASSLVVVGEVVEQNRMTEGYGMALNARTPFRVKVLRVLRGELADPAKLINVGVTRDEVKFRYETGNTFIFFLKPESDDSLFRRDPNMGRPEWRAVADYFGIIPHTLAVEHIIKEAELDN